MSNINIISGPPTSKVSKEEAEAQLLAHKSFPKNASYALSEVEGRWIAAIAAGPFEPSGEEPSDGPPKPDFDSEPEEKSDGGSDFPEEKKEDHEPKKEDKGDKEKGGELGEIKELLTTLLTALGLSPEGAEDSPIPGLEGPPPPPGDHNPAVPGEQGADNKTHTVHERALKPGESPPGTTPVGAPAFASVSDNHPWREVIGKKKSFVVEEPIANARLADVQAELSKLAEGTGYSVKQLREGNVDGKRTARALISQ